MKISFLDFWDGFDVNNNFFLHTLSLIDKVEVTDPSNSDYIIFSCFGNKNIQFKNKKRIFYTGENIRPDYYNIDFALSFDFTDNGKNIRLPLWMLQIDWFNKVNYTNPKYTIPYNNLLNNRYYNKPKDKFCSIVFNSNSPYRYEIIGELSKYKKVDCFGKPFGNWFYGEDSKLETISNYKFNICFENAIHPGYYTEKPIHAKSAGCVPIYWSDENISKDFNKNAFINLSDFNNNVKDLAEYIIEVDKDEEKYLQIKNQNIFLPEQDPKYLFEDLINKIKKIIKK